MGMGMGLGVQNSWVLCMGLGVYTQPIPKTQNIFIPKPIPIPKTQEFFIPKPMPIHWNGKNNHFRFSLSLFTFFILKLFLEKWKSDFLLFKSESESEKSEKITFQKRK